ncbi:MAG TPA: PTS sugar transporter subunit IIA [Candidatus Aminicenantes bacterium]|nr:PTS sugar transporter subunit IIA [Candidatus Aminicenantes bacterium]
MRLADYLDRKLIFLDLGAPSKEAAITEIVRRMKDCQAIRDEEAVLEEIFSRESRGGTSLGNGVAIPHARVKSIDRIVMAMAKLSDGVNFSNEDRQPVRVVFLLVTPLEKLNEYLKVLAGLAKFMKDRKLLKRLFAVDSAEGAWELFDSLEPRAD